MLQEDSVIYSEIIIEVLALSPYQMKPVPSVIIRKSNRM